MRVRVRGVLFSHGLKRDPLNIAPAILIDDNIGLMTDLNFSPGFYIAMCLELHYENIMITIVDVHRIY